MVKDSVKYVSTDGWRYAQFNDCKPIDTLMLKSCFQCHQAIKDRDHDYVVTHYAQ